MKWRHITFFMLIIILMAGILYADSAKDVKICNTRECREMAEKIRFNMNHSADPCDNFYNYVCGGFEEKTQLADDEIKVSSFSTVDDKIIVKMRDLLEDDNLGKEQESFTLAQTYYKACMKEHQIEALGIGPLEKVIGELGGWPLLEGILWDEAGFKWYEKILLLRQKGFPTNHFLTFSITSDLKNNSKIALGLDQPGFALDNKHLKEGYENPGVKAYISFILDAIKELFGGDLKASAHDVANVLIFEMMLANISESDEERRNISNSYTVMTVGELASHYPRIPWLEYINGLIGVTKIDVNQEIVVFSPNYFKLFYQLMLQTPKRIQADFLVWRIVMASMNHLNSKARSLIFKYYQAITGVQGMTERWKKCVGETSDRLDLPYGSMFIKKVFDNSTIKPIMDLVAGVKGKFAEHLLKNKWIDQETKMKALEKVSLMKENIGYPDQILNDEAIQKFYSNLKLTESSYFENVLEVSLFVTNYLYSKFDSHEADEYKWIEFGAPSVVNAFYNPLGNSINIPGAILRRDFFSTMQSNYMNYGAIGAIIGHEITHGFDDVGRQFDEKGNLRDWWDPDTKKIFINRTKCLIKEYDNFKNTKLNISVNGKRTLGENIADNEGIKLAYEAYLQSFPDSSEGILPGLNFTSRQLFWMSLGNVWCRKVRMKALPMMFRDEHPPAVYRVIGPLSNMEEFANDFQCPLGSKMNPKNKCKVW